MCHEFHIRPEVVPERDLTFTDHTTCFVTLKKEHLLGLLKETVFISDPKVDWIRGCWRNL